MIYKNGAGRFSVMTQAILKAVAQDNPVSFEEVQAAYTRLNSIDAIMVAIELSVLTDRTFAEAIEVICKSSQICTNNLPGYIEVNM